MGFISALVGGSASKKAAKAQEKADEKAIEEQRRQFDLSRLDFGPPRFYGSAALRQMAGGELGLPDLGPISYDPKTGEVGLWSPQTALAALGTSGTPGAPATATPLAALGQPGQPGQPVPPATTSLSGQPIPGRRIRYGSGEGDDSSFSDGSIELADGSFIDAQGNFYTPYNRPGAGGAQPVAAPPAAPGVGGPPQVPPFGQSAIGTLRSGFRESPGYQFQLSEGLQAVDRSANARGMYGSGARAKGLMRFATGLADADYSDYYNRLSNIATGGSAATNSLATLGANTANNISSLTQHAGAARASGYIGQANAIQQGIQNTIGLASMATGGFGGGGGVGSGFAGGSSLYGLRPGGSSLINWFS